MFGGSGARLLAPNPSLIIWLTVVRGSHNSDSNCASISRLVPVEKSVSAQEGAQDIHDLVLQLASFGEQPVYITVNRGSYAISAETYKNHPLYWACISFRTLT